MYSDKYQVKEAKRKQLFCPETCFTHRHEGGEWRHEIKKKCTHLNWNEKTPSKKINKIKLFI